MAHTLRFLSAEDVGRALSVRQAIPLMREAFIRLSSREAAVPLRTKIEVPGHDGTVLYMPVHVPAQELFGVKVVSLFKHNPAAGLPLIHALVLVCDGRNGRPLAVMDGERLTALRTGAASGLATELLARRDSETVAVFGAGTQGRTQLEAVCAVRPVKRAWVFDKDSSRADLFGREMSGKLAIPVTAAASPERLRDADIVCTVTTSPVPVFAATDLKAGVHINAVGAYKPAEREIPEATVCAAKLVVDQREACLSEAGDVVIPLRQGLIGPDHIHAEIGEVAAGRKPGRTGESEITLFKSVGNAVQDLAAAAQVLENARTLGLGTEVRLLPEGGTRLGRSRRMRRPSLASNALAAALGLCGCAGPAFGADEATQKPNLVLCMTDDQGWADVSYNGLTRIRTPALDAMAAAGVRFNRFYAQQSCTPTRASVMTGRHPNRMGAFWPGMPLRKQELTIARAVKTSGYLTGHFGKWHLNGVAGPGKPIAPSDPLGPGPFGFDEWFSVSNYFDVDWTFSRKGENVKASGDGSDAIVAEALKFIGEAAKRKQPFLAVVWFGSPHAPHKPLPEDLKTAGGSAYYGELVGVDRAMGTLRKGLRDLGVAENTMLWFNSDNGGWYDPAKPDANGETGGLRGRKGDMWEGGLRVPAIVEWPARIKPSVTDVPACVCDIYPTITDVLRLDVPNQVQPLDGISLLPLLDGRMKERPRPLGFWQYDDRRGVLDTDSGPSAWTDNRYKLVKPAPGKWELYDLTGDPAEKTDLAAKLPEIVARMKVELEHWQQSVLRSHRGEDYPDKLPAPPK